MDRVSTKVTSELVKEKAKKSGADIVGIASVERFEDEVSGYKPTDLLTGAKSVISVGIRQLRSYMEKAPNTIYFMYGYRQKNDYINEICWNITRLLDDDGYSTLPVQPWEAGEMILDTQPHVVGSFSHVKAAVAAGLGEIGLSGMFLSPEYGPRVHLGSVITTAPFVPDPLFEGELCPRENCLECIKQCPAQAISIDGTLNDISCIIALDKLSTDYEETIKQILERQAKEEPLKRVASAVGYSDFNGFGFCAIPCINACPIGKKELL